MLPSGLRTPSAPRLWFRGSITRPAHSLCTLRSRDHSRTTQHSVPAGCLPFAGQDSYLQDPCTRFQLCHSIGFPPCPSFLVATSTHPRGPPAALRPGLYCWNLSGRRAPGAVSVQTGTRPERRKPEELATKRAEGAVSERSERINMRPVRPARTVQTGKLYNGDVGSLRVRSDCQERCLTGENRVCW